MAHYVKSATKVTGRKHIINTNTHLNVYVHSTYDLGYVFGAFVSVGISDLPKHYSHMGQVSFYTDGTPDLTKLSAAIKNSFNLDSKIVDKSNGRQMLVVYNKPMARLLQEFGKKERRHVPDKYIVNNTQYLQGILDGIEDFKGHLEDTRGVINPRKVSISVQNLYSIIKNWLTN